MVLGTILWPFNRLFISIFPKNRERWIEWRELRNQSQWINKSAEKNPKLNKTTKINHPTKVGIDKATKES